MLKANTHTRTHARTHAQKERERERERESNRYLLNALGRSPFKRFNRYRSNPIQNIILTNVTSRPQGFFILDNFLYFGKKEFRIGRVWKDVSDVSLASQRAMT